MESHVGSLKTEVADDLFQDKDSQTSIFSFLCSYKHVSMDIKQTEICFPSIQTVTTYE